MAPTYSTALARSSTSNPIHEPLIQPAKQRRQERVSIAIPQEQGASVPESGGFRTFFRACRGTGRMRREMLLGRRRTTMATSVRNASQRGLLRQPSDNRAMSTPATSSRTRGRPLEPNSTSGKIRALLAAGTPEVDIAKKLGCSPAQGLDLTLSAASSSPQPVGPQPSPARNML
jgi:hypothetical protein